MNCIVTLDRYFDLKKKFKISEVLRDFNMFQIVL